MREPIPAIGPVSLEEYLAFENASERRHEFVAGHIYAMSGTTVRHNQVASNIHAVLRAACRDGPCRAFIIDLKVLADDRVYYPDGVVVCTPHGGDTLMFDDPCLVVEVTSRSTQRIDRGEKLEAYLRIPSLRAYLIAEQSRRHVTLYTREQAADWARDEIVASGRITLPCPVTTFALDDVYEGVELPPPRVREDVDDEWSEMVDIG